MNNHDANDQQLAGLEAVNVQYLGSKMSNKREVSICMICSIRYML